MRQKISQSSRYEFEICEQNLFFKFQDIAGKTQQKRLKVNINEINLQEMTIKHKDLNNYKKNYFSYQKIELLLNINKTLSSASESFSSLSSSLFLLRKLLTFYRPHPPVQSQPSKTPLPPS